MSGREAALIGGPLDGWVIVVSIPPRNLLEFPHQNSPVQFGERGDVIGGDVTYALALYELDRASADAFEAERRAGYRTGRWSASPVHLVYRHRP